MTTTEVIAYLRLNRPQLSELQRLRVAMAAIRVIRRVPMNHAGEVFAICIGGDHE